MGCGQRTIVRQAGAKGKLRKVHKLKLLVEYVGNKPIRQHLEFLDRAQQLVNRPVPTCVGARARKGDRAKQIEVDA